MEFFFFFFFYHLHFRSGLFTNILLVLVISITCVQTKEITNSSVLQDVSESNHSSIDISSTSNNAHNNHNLSHHITDNNSAHDLAHLTNLNGTHNSDNKIQTIDKHPSPLVADAQIIHSNYSIYNNDHIEISNSNELDQSELPTAIDNDYQLTTVQSESTTERNGKDANLLKSALRVAARQGYEAMVDLYNKKEPNLISKGQLYTFY